MLKQSLFAILVWCIGQQALAQASSPPGNNSKEPFYNKRTDFVKAADVQAASTIPIQEKRHPKPRLSGGIPSDAELEEQIYVFQSKITEALIYPAQNAEQILYYTEAVNRLKKARTSSK